MEDELCVVAKQPRNKQFDEKLREKQAELARIKKQIREKQKNYLNSSSMSSSVNQTSKSSSKKSSEQQDESKLTELHEKEDFNRT